MNITVVESSEFRREAQDLLDEDEQEKLITYLSMQPKAGVLIQGTGGVRKLRWARAGSGKSSGVRIVYFFHNETMPLFLLTVYAKNDKENLTKAERNDLAAVARVLLMSYRRKLL